MFQDPRADVQSLEAASLFAVPNKVALVTGGSVGIGCYQLYNFYMHFYCLGFMIAKGLVVNGATVFICSRKKHAVDRAVSELVCRSIKF